MSFFSTTLLKATGNFQFLPPECNNWIHFPIKKMLMSKFGAFLLPQMLYSSNTYSYTTQYYEWNKSQSNGKRHNKSCYQNQVSHMQNELPYTDQYRFSQARKSTSKNLNVQNPLWKKDISYKIQEKIFNYCHLSNSSCHSTHRLQHN